MQSKSRPNSYSKGKVYNSSAGFQLGQSAQPGTENKYGSQLGLSSKPAGSSGSTGTGYRGNSTGYKPASRPYSPSGSGSRPYTPSSAPRPYTPSSAPRPYSTAVGSTSPASGAPAVSGAAPVAGVSSTSAPRPYTPSTGGYRPNTGGSGGYRGGSSSGGYAGGGYSGGYNSGGPRRSFDNRNDFRKKDTGPNRNYWIRAPKVLVIDDEGNNLGELAIEAALALAKERELDLVEVSPNANPPVCRIIDYSKYLYEQKKKAKGAKSTLAKEMKELKFSPVIDDHDIEVRIKRAFEFMGKGHNVRLTIEKKGRQTMDQVNAVMARLLTSFEGYSTIEPEPKTEGKRTYITLKNDGKAKNKKNISEKS
jgi:translation initiation factor IF-3